MEEEKDGLWSWISGRLLQPSTARGLVWVATAAGVQLDPSVAAQIVGVAAGVVGLIDMIKDDRKARP
jgi:hypothetical protein